MRPVELRSTERENRKRRFQLYATLIVGFAMGTVLTTCSYELMPPANAAEATMPVKVEIVQCGSRSNLPEACSLDDRCCALIEPAAGEQDGLPENHPQTVYEVHDWSWTEAPADSYHETTIYE